VSNYLKRIERLENLVVEQETPGPVFIICLDARKDADGIERPIVKMHCGGETWDRLPGESEKEFSDRAVSEAKRGMKNSIPCFICSSREGSSSEPLF
jgi:hypothetical protein